MRMDDFICLGRTVPEESKKYGHKVCMAGVSLELNSLLRVYPLAINNPIRARMKCVLDVQRNPQDTRKESWKLKDHKEGVISVSPATHAIEKNIRPFLEPFLCDSISKLNEERRSLGVLKLNNPYGHFRERKSTPHPDQGLLFDIADECFGANAIDLAPYIEFKDDGGYNHNLQIREWGCYERIRKDRHKAFQLWDILGLTKNRTIWAIVGNQCNHRSSWLIIATFQIKKEFQGQLFNGRIDYVDYLDSSDWQVKAEAALERAGHRCQLCNLDAPILNVHHRTYERIGGNELPEDLIVLCRRCHAKHHGIEQLAR